MAKFVPLITRQLQDFLYTHFSNGATFLVRKDCDGAVVYRVGKVYTSSSRLKAVFHTDTNGETSWEIISTKGTFEQSQDYGESNSQTFAELLLECGRTFAVCTPTVETVALVSIFNGGDIGGRHFKYHPVEVVS